MNTALLELFEAKEKSYRQVHTLPNGDTLVRTTICHISDEDMKEIRERIFSGEFGSPWEVLLGGLKGDEGE